MMKRLQGLLVGLSLALVLGGGSLYAAGITRISFGSALPTNCVNGDIFIKTSATAGLYWCSTPGSPGTWSAVGGGTVTATGTLTSGKAIIGNGGSDITVSAATGVAHLSSGTLTGSNVNLGSEVTSTLPVANGGTNLTAATDDSTVVGNGTTWQSKALPSCSNATTSKLLYDTGTNAFSCGTDQTGSASGKVIQVVVCPFSAVATGTGRIPNDDTIPQNTEGDQYMTCAITPTNASSALVITATMLTSCSVGASSNMALFQDTTANALTGTGGHTSTAADWYMQMHLPEYSMTAGTTSSTTFKIRASCSLGTMTFNGFAGGRIFSTIPKSSMQISEILP